MKGTQNKKKNLLIIKVLNYDVQNSKLFHCIILANITVHRIHHPPHQICTQFVFFCTLLDQPYEFENFVCKLATILPGSPWHFIPIHLDIDKLGSHPFKQVPTFYSTTIHVQWNSLPSKRSIILKGFFHLSQAKNANRTLWHWNKLAERQKDG